MWDSGRFVQTDSKPRAVEPKKLFLSILKIDAIYGKYALIFGTPRRVDDTQAISESNLPSQEVYLFLKQNKIQKTTGYSTHLGNEIFAQEFAFV